MSENELLSYETIYGKTYNQIKSDWMTYLKQFDGAMTEEEYDENYNKILQEHGFELEGKGT